MYVVIRYEKQFCGLGREAHLGLKSLLCINKNSSHLFQVQPFVSYSVCRRTSEASK